MSIQNNNNNMSVADIQNQEVIDKALIAAGLPQNKLNGLVSMIQSKLLCDSACQKERTEKELKVKLDLAQNNLKNAPQEVEDAEKNYYLYTKGTAGYDNKRFKRNLQNSITFKENTVKRHEEMMDEMKVLINDYNSDKIYTQRMNEMLEIKLSTDKKLKEKIDDHKSRVHTNDRRVHYEHKDIDWVITIRFILTIIYYILFIIYFLVSDYFPTSKYKNKKLWGYIVLYLIFPYLLNSIIKSVFNVNKYIYNAFIHN
jgi:hypothetical protein